MAKKIIFYKIWRGNIFHEEFASFNNNNTIEFKEFPEI